MPGIVRSNVDIADTLRSLIDLLLPAIAHCSTPTRYRLVSILGSLPGDALYASGTVISII